jgi:hypothetical protein
VLRILRPEEQRELNERGRKIRSPEVYPRKAPGRLPKLGPALWLGGRLAVVIAVFVLVTYWHFEPERVAQFADHRGQKQDPGY